ncbi:MAG: UDP-3-O-(3-hydroxymyristoyl)glucosamine N-acyltransferase [Verrucomicrobia bacterium]|nr:UDP-3-O-(3-hydroxymyristoyl)glucosamine N-acyltransferase [Verrucomicrobiota bacterium]MBI3869745.1 UDP-3-O-(3-hydroxymyristoyl)glucosamine N-acyltransferase [Verrucomicrobiota bacterium]
MAYTAAEIATHLQGEVLGDPTTMLTGFASAEGAKPGDLTFAENEYYFTRAEQGAAAAILVPAAEFTAANKVLIRVGNPRVAFARVLPLFFPQPAFQPGIHPTAVIHPSATIDPTASIGPLVYVGSQVRIGPRSSIQCGCVLGENVELGNDCQLFPRVTLYPQVRLGSRVIIHSGTVIGSDGFGYVFDENRHLKIPQVGSVVVHDDVEIGANVTVDRGALGPTVIGKGTKIDNLVQVGHNVVIGEHSLLVAQVGIAGSTRLGNYVTLGGQVGVAGHLKLGTDVTVAAQSGVMNHIPDGEKWLGSPARPDRQTKRQLIALQQLPELLRRVSELERQAGIER